MFATITSRSSTHVNLTLAQGARLNASPSVPPSSIPLFLLFPPYILHLSPSLPPFPSHPHLRDWVVDGAGSGLAGGHHHGGGLRGVGAVKGLPGKTGGGVGQTHRGGWEDRRCGWADRQGWVLTRYGVERRGLPPSNMSQVT